MSCTPVSCPWATGRVGQVLNPPPLVLKSLQARHLGSSACILLRLGPEQAMGWSPLIGLGLVAEDRPTEFSCSYLWGSCALLWVHLPGCWTSHCKLQLLLPGNLSRTSQDLRSIIEHVQQNTVHGQAEHKINFKMPWTACMQCSKTHIDTCMYTRYV